MVRSHHGSPHSSRGEARGGAHEREQHAVQHPVGRAHRGARRRLRLGHHDGAERSLTLADALGVRALTGERGRLYEIPLLFAFSVVLAALAAPYLEPRRGVTSLVVLGALLLLGLGASALLGAAVSPRVRLLGLPAAVVVFVALSLITAPLLRRLGVLAPLLLPAQIYVAYRVELLLAGVKARRERAGGSG